MRGVAQERYARYKVEDWKRAQGDGGFAPEDVPIVYDGKPMRLEDAVSIAVQKIAYAQAKGLSPAEEDLAVKRIYEDAYNYYSDNGFIDYDEFREYVRSIHVRPSRYEDTLFQIEEIEKIMAYPREKRMMYHRESLAGTPREWDSEARFGISNVGEIRDVYAISDGLGTTEYVDVAYVQNEYEEAKGKLEASKEDQKRYEDEVAFYYGFLPEQMPLLEKKELPLPAVMEQTWFTNRPEGDVSHLISWLDPVTPEQMDWIVEAAEKAGFTEKEIAFLWGRHKKGESTPQGRVVYMRLETIFHSRANKKPLESYTGDEVQAIHDRMVFEYGKLASEFLLTADIDGVRYPVNYRRGSRHGEQGWNYVAFSDEHLRVDHVYEYNPETDEFEKKWHEAEGAAGPRFTETPLGQELVAKAFDAIVGSRVDLLLRPSRYYGNPYETAKRNPRDGLVVEKLGREIDVSEPKGFAAEVSAEISRFGTREGDPTLREIRARCGSKARFYEVLGAVYETAEAVRSGLADVVTGRERAMMENAGLQAADKIARAKPETVRVIAEGKLGRVARVLRLAQNADIVTLARRRIKSALAEANKRLSSANSGMRTRYMTAMRKQAKELIKTMQLAVSAQDNTKASEKKRYAMLAERARLAEELKVIESGKTPDDLAKDETLTDRQHQDAVKLMFLEKFGDLSYTIDPAEVWAKAAEAEAFVVS